MSCCCILFVVVQSIRAQGPISGFMNAAGTTTLALNYGYESYDRYLFGQEERPVSNDIQSVSLFTEHAFSDSLSLVLNVPYVWVDRRNSGFQDGIISLKYRNHFRRFDDGGSLSVITAAGVSFPLWQYPTDT
ncbi:MAG: hypothetical protein R3350_10870, partial [Saprospiraceae bacterium]|nr:hypothetical protein [Saprospiraceae bacterium]